MVVEWESESSLYWKDGRWEYSGGSLIYRGLSATADAATDQGDLWYIWKWEWAGGNLVRRQGPLVGNWDDRASLAWGT